MRDMKTLAPIIDSTYRTERTYQPPHVKRTFKDRGLTIEIEGPADAVREQERLLRAEETKKIEAKVCNCADDATFHADRCPRGQQQELTARLRDLAKGGA